MSNEHLLRKAILICQTSALVDVLSDGEIMSAIMHVYDTLSGEGNTVEGSHHSENGTHEGTEEVKKLVT